MDTENLKSKLSSKVDDISNKERKITIQETAITATDTTPLGRTSEIQQAYRIADEQVGGEVRL